MPPFAGSLPPGLTGAPPGAGPAVAPHGNPGNITESLSKLKLATQMLQEALPGIPMGTPLHKEVMKSVTSIGKHMTEMQNSPQAKIQQLLTMVQRARAMQPNAALGALGGPPAPPPGGQPPGLMGAAPPSPTPPPAAMAA